MVKIPFSYRVRESRRELTSYPGPDFLALIEFATIQRGLLLQPPRGRDAYYEYVDHGSQALGGVAAKPFEKGFLPNQILVFPVSLRVE
jgi:hypothetical protein